jgi:hypothetical protein
MQAAQERAHVLLLVPHAPIGHSGILGHRVNGISRMAAIQESN